MVGILLRGLLALALLGSATVHLLEWVDQTVEIVRFLFLVNVVAGIVIAAAVLVWRHWLPLLAAIGFGAGTLGAYLLALTVGLFGVEKQFTTATEVWGVVTEVACILLGGLLLLRRDWRSAKVGAHAR
jgi:hypothetical protein